MNEHPLSWFLSLTRHKVGTSEMNTSSLDLIFQNWNSVFLFQALKTSADHILNHCVPKLCSYFPALCLVKPSCEMLHLQLLRGHNISL